MEKKILNYFNVKLELQLTGNEDKLYLNDKKINDIDLELLSEIEFKNLKEIDLSHNNISNIKYLKNFKNLISLDLSLNIINNLESLKM